jgi:cobalt-zinc-cadmium efflux system protein
VGGILTNSMAILSDAIHDLGDSITLGLAWYFQKVATKGRNEKYTYGYKRFSLLGAIINSIILTLGSILILIETIPRIINPEVADAKGMIWLAIIGIIANGAAVLRLKKGNSINEKVVSLHLLEDVLGWIAILIGSIIMYFFDIPIIDPLLSIGISIYILVHVFRNISETIRIFLQGSPENIDQENLRENLTKVEGIREIHDLHLWTVDGNYHVATMHVVTENNINMEEMALLKNEIREKLDAMQIHHATIEFESIEEKCAMEHCSL